MLHNLSLLHISPRPNKFCNQGLTVPYRIDSDDSGGNNDDDSDDIDAALFYKDKTESLTTDKPSWLLVSEEERNLKTLRNIAIVHAGFWT